MIQTRPPWEHAHARRLQATSAATLDMEEDIVLAMSNRGTTFQLFRNPYIESRLAQMGLREDNVFGCAMDFLFK